MMIGNFIYDERLGGGLLAPYTGFWRNVDQTRSLGNNLNVLRLEIGKAVKGLSLYLL
jgi:hypothetical protein